MKKISLHLDVKKIPPVMLRKRHILILIRDREGRYVLGHKKIYPKGIYRMVGGGVENTETFDEAAKREMYEELKVYPESQQIKELIQVYAHIRDAEGLSSTFTTSVFFFELTDEHILPGDDLDGVVRLTDAEYQALITRYFLLSKDIDPQLGFAWDDYGRLYGAIHRMAYEEAPEKATSRNAF